MFILELAIGQRLRKGSIGVWKQVKIGFFTQQFLLKTYAMALILS